MMHLLYQILMILKIILIPILLLILSGFLPGRALFPKNDRYYYIGAFNKVLFVINGKTAFPIVPLFWPLRHIQIELTWTEYKKPNETYTALTTYSNVEKAIGIKSELTDIRLLEEHPIEINVILKDGFEAVIIFDVTLSQFAPMKLLPRKNFLPYVQQEFSDIVSPWAHGEKDIESILLIEIREVKSQICFDINGVNYNIWDYLNEFKFKEFGFCIKELSLKAGFGATAKNYFDIKNNQKIEEAKLGEKEAIEKRKVQERITFKNDADAAREAQKKDLEVTQQYQEAIMEKAYAGQAKVAEAYKANVLIINGSETGDNEVSQARSLTNATTAALIARHAMPSSTPSANSQTPTTP